MSLKINIKRFFVCILFITVGLQKISSQEKCLLEILNDELVEVNSEEFFNYFEENPGKGYNSWYVLYKADKDISRFEVSSLKQLSNYLVSTEKKVDDVIDEIKLAEGYKNWKLKNQEGSFVSSLSHLKQKNASVAISWKNLDSENIIWVSENNNKFSTAKDFANEKGEFFYDIILDNGRYVKFDLDTGKILLGNTNGTYEAFAVVDNAILASFKSPLADATDDVIRARLADFLYEKANKLEVLSGKISKELDIPGKLASKSLNPAKVSTLLGRFNPDITQLFEELGSFKNIGLGETKGGINILNRPDHYGNQLKWWNSYNKPWLDKAISRGDDIYLMTIPERVEEIILDGKLLGVYAEELNHLEIKNYKPKNINETDWAVIRSWFTYRNLNNDYLNSLDNIDKARFLADLQASSELVDALKKSSDLVDVWVSVKYVGDATRTNVTFLEKLNFLKGVNGFALRAHIFTGDYRKVTGCHYYNGVDNVNVRFINGVTPETNSFGVIKGDIEMRKPI